MAAGNNEQTFVNLVTYNDLQDGIRGLFDNSEFKDGTVIDQLNTLEINLTGGARLDAEEVEVDDYEPPSLGDLRSKRNAPASHHLVFLFQPNGEE